jgi:hypothetical protein
MTDYDTNNMVLVKIQTNGQIEEKTRLKFLQDGASDKMAGIIIGVWTGAELLCRRMLDLVVEVSIKKSSLSSKCGE